MDNQGGSHNAKRSEHPSHPRLVQRVEFLIPTAVTYGMQVESLPL